MERYINSYATSGDVQTAIDNGSLGKPYVAYVEGDGAIDWNTKSIDYSKMYLTIEIVSAGTITLKVSYSYYANVSYSINGGDWILSDRENVTRELGTFNVGDKIQFKGYAGDSFYYVQELGGTAYYKAYGNLASVIGGSPESTSNGYTGLKFSSNLTDVSNLVINKYAKLASNFEKSKITIGPNFIDDEIAYFNSDVFARCTKLASVTLPSKVNDGYMYNTFGSVGGSLNYVVFKCSQNVVNNIINSWNLPNNSGTFVKATGVDFGNKIGNNWTVIEE